jgi:hypothetical protein
MKKYTTYGRVEREGTPNTDDLMKHKSCSSFICSKFFAADQSDCGTAVDNDSLTYGATINITYNP